MRINNTGRGANHLEITHCLRFAVVGLQHFHVHEMIQGMLNVPGIEFVAIADSDENILIKNQLRYKVHGYEDYREMLEEEHLDVIGCCAIPSHRADIIATCLNNGLHVISDKPVATTLDDLVKIENALDSGRALLSVMFTERFNPPVCTLKKLVDEGALGRIANFIAIRSHKLMKEARPAWMFRRETYGGILVDLAIHDIDIFNWIAGINMAYISAWHANVGCQEYPEFEDAGTIMLSAVESSSALVRVDWLAPREEIAHGDCRFFVIGTKGSAEAKVSGDISLPGGSVRICTHYKPPMEIPLVEPEKSLYEDFIDAVRSNASGYGITEDINSTQRIITHQDIITASRVVLLARESADRNQLYTL